MSGLQKDLCAIVLLLITGPLVAQDDHLKGTENACGDRFSHFTVKLTDESSHASAPPPGSSLVYFIEDQEQARPGAAHCFHCQVQVQLGIDGKWMAADRGFSHSIVSVSPGVHHLCASVDTRMDMKKYWPSLKQFNVEPGKVYYLRARLTPPGLEESTIMHLEEIDEDLGSYLVQSSKLSDFILDTK